MYKVPFLQSIINTLQHDCKTNRLILFKQTELERSKSQGKLSLCGTKTKHHPTEVCEEIEVYFYAFLTYRIYRFWMRTSCSGYFTPEKKLPLLIVSAWTLGRSALILITIMTELPRLPHRK